MSNFHSCVYLTWFICRLRSKIRCRPIIVELKKKIHINNRDLSVNILPLSGWQERKKKSLLFFSSERSAVWQWSNLLVMWLHSLLRWRWSFIDDSLWNLSSTAAEDSIYSSARLKYQAACPKWKMPPHIQTKTLQQWVSDGFLVYKYMHVYTFLWTLFKGINFFFLSIFLSPN